MAYFADFNGQWGNFMTDALFGWRRAVNPPGRCGMKAV